MKLLTYYSINLRSKESMFSITFLKSNELGRFGKVLCSYGSPRVLKNGSNKPGTNKPIIFV